MVVEKFILVCGHSNFGHFTMFSFLLHKKYQISSTRFAVNGVARNNSKQARNVCQALPRLENQIARIS